MQNRKKCKRIPKKSTVRLEKNAVRAYLNNRKRRKTTVLVRHSPNGTRPGPIRKTRMPEALKLSIVIPVYNEERYIDALLERICAVRFQDGVAKE